MKKREKKQDRINDIQKILIYFSTPKTPCQVEKELGIKKIKTKKLLKQNLIIPLNPEAKKGRLYIRNDNEYGFNQYKKYKEWDLAGWLISSPRQRSVILKTVAIDSVKRNSEAIRYRASKFNKRLTRISTKEILKELTEKDLVKSKIGLDQKRYYWISEKGKEIYSDLEKLNLDDMTHNNKYKY